MGLSWACGTLQSWSSLSDDVAIGERVQILEPSRDREEPWFAIPRTKGFEVGEVVRQLKPRFPHRLSRQAIGFIAVNEYEAFATEMAGIGGAEAMG